MKLQIEEIKKEIDALHRKFGDQNYRIIYGTGCVKNPKVFFLLMNPTARNLSTHADWKGLRASWVGHKKMWSLFADVGVFDKALNTKVQALKSGEWTPELVEEIYENLAEHKAYATGLGRCVQPDARPLPNSVFQESRAVTLAEIAQINPSVIISFGNQVSSNLLGVPIKVSENRRAKYILPIGKKQFAVYPTFYPVGMGLRNIGKAIEDIRYILKKQK